jgi:DNA-binding MarR family transcriptional regulator
MNDVKWLDDREQQAWRSLVAMQEGLDEFIDRQLRSRCGLSSADYRVLAHLSEASEGRLRSFELARLLRWEKSRLSQHLGRMQTRGLVSRERSVDDRRGVVVAITSRGRELIEAAAPQHVADVRSVIIDHLSAPELAMLTAISEKVRERLAMLEPDI